MRGHTLVLVLAGDAFEANRLIAADREDRDEEEVAYLFVNRPTLMKGRIMEAGDDILVGARFQQHPLRSEIEAAVDAAKKRGARK